MGLRFQKPMRLQDKALHALEKALDSRFESDEWSGLQQEALGEEFSLALFT
jgi:hypothetical protein